MRDLKIGLHAFGNDGANAPPAHALARRGIVRNIVGFTILGTEDSAPGKIIDAVASGEIDVAVVWGPFAGYFARRKSVQLALMPISSTGDDASLPFVFAISLGVRPGDTAFKEKLEGILDRKSAEIQTVLKAYGVPLVGAERLAPQMKIVLNVQKKAVSEKEKIMQVTPGVLMTITCLGLLMVATVATALTPAEEGRRVYLRENCYGCHGGRAGGGMGPNFRGDRPDADDVSEAVRRGEDGGMPAYPNRPDRTFKTLTRIFGHCAPVANPPSRTGGSRCPAI